MQSSWDFSPLFRNPGIIRVFKEGLHYLSKPNKVSAVIFRRWHAICELNYLLFWTFSFNGHVLVSKHRNDLSSLRQTPSPKRGGFTKCSKEYRVIKNPVSVRQLATSQHKLNSQNFGRPRSKGGRKGVRPSLTSPSNNILSPIIQFSYLTWL